jgi:hypothetical protein
MKKAMVLNKILKAKVLTIPKKKNTHCKSLGSIDAYFTCQTHCDFRSLFPISAAFYDAKQNVAKKSNFTFPSNSQIVLMFATSIKCGDLKYIESVIDEKFFTLAEACSKGNNLNVSFTKPFVILVFNGCDRNQVFPLFEEKCTDAGFEGTSVFLAWEFLERWSIFAENDMLKFNFARFLIANKQDHLFEEQVGYTQEIFQAIYGPDSLDMII